MKLQTSLLLLLVSCQIWAQSPSVYPGDFNMDGRVNVSDVLYLGQAYNETGNSRPNATLNWIPQAATDCGDSICNVDFKYIDGNGDGMIDTLDLEAISVNFDSTHTEVIRDSLDVFNNFHITHEYSFIGDMIMDRRYIVDIKGAASTPTGGLALTFDYSSFKAPIAVRVDTTDSWLEPDILLVVNDTINQRLHIVITRTDQTDRWAIDGRNLFSIFICEDVASLVGDYEVNPVKLFDIERMNSAGDRYFIDSFEYDDGIIDPSLVEPLCVMLYDAEQCQYRNGTQDGDSFDEWSDGFRGDFSNETFVSIGAACQGFGQSDALLNFDTLQFYTKVSEAGLGAPLYFDIDGIQSINISDYIEDSTITTDYKLVSIPIDILGGEQLNAIEWLNFSTGTPVADFYVFVDLITARNNSSDTLIIWNGSQCGYNRGRLNSDEAHSGNYCFEAIPDYWANPSISFFCEGELTWRQDWRASDSLVFYAKANAIGKQFGVFFTDWVHCFSGSDTVDILPYIHGGSLDTTYKRVSIPISEFPNPECWMNSIETIIFPVDTADFRFFIDDIHVVSCDSEDIDALGLCNYCTPDTVNAKNIIDVTKTTEVTNLVDVTNTIDKIRLDISPNPVLSGQQIQIEIENPISKAHIQIIDIQGRVHYSAEEHLYEKNTMNIPAGLATGMYFLKIYDLENNRFGTQKLLIMNR